MRAYLPRAYGCFGWNDQRKIDGRTARVLLKAAKKECFVPSKRTARREAVDIAAEYRLARVVHPVDIRNGIEKLRLIPPQHCSVQTVRAGFRDDVKDTAAGFAELNAKVAGLH